jgi:hypothetical protein
MTSPTFFRWDGLALLVGSLVFAIATALSLFIPGPLGPSGPPPVWDAWLGAISGLIFVIGLPALYAVQSQRAGVIGLLGFIGLLVGILLLAVVSNVIPAIAFANYVPPAIPSSQEETGPPLFVIIIFIIGGLSLIAGSVLFGLAVLRTKVFASWTAWALIVLSVLSIGVGFLPFEAAFLIGSIATILYVLVFSWYGYQLAFQTGTFVEVTAGGGSGTSEPSSSS